MRKLKEWTMAIVVSVIAFVLVFGYVTYLQDHGCVIGTHCISITH